MFDYRYYSRCRQCGQPIQPRYLENNLCPECLEEIEQLSTPASVPAEPESPQSNQ